jgi:membrane protein implicated in regulation of membrane protease activity
LQRFEEERTSMATYWVWWAVAAVIVGSELLIGTFYLLAVGVAFALGGVAALLGMSIPVQLIVAGFLAVVLTIIAHRWHQAHPVTPQLPSFDIGQSVQVDAWRDDGTARVNYRGTQWDAELADPRSAKEHTMVIVGTRGSTLMLGPIK